MLKRFDRLPRYITIRHERWKVLMKGRNEMSRIKEIKGEYYYELKEIWIWKGLQGKARWVTLLHEIMHIAFGKANGDDGVSLALEEKIMHTMDEPLFDILNLNFGFGPEQ